MRNEVGRFIGEVIQNENDCVTLRGRLLVAHLLRVKVTVAQYQIKLRIT